MLKTLSSRQLIRPWVRLPVVSLPVRSLVHNFHQPDVAGSDQPAEAADAAATILADLRDTQTNPNKATWIEALKEREKQLAEGKVIDSFAYVDPKTTVIGEKTRADSFSYLTLPFKQDQWLCDAYINAFGRLRAGQLFQDLDALAGRIAYRHCAPAEPVNVTASVDRIYMVKKVDEIVNYNFVLAGFVSWTGRSSMEITVRGYAFEDEIPKVINHDTLPLDQVFLTANFTFVARNPITHKSFAINRLLPVTEQDWIDYRRAESHNAKKKLSAKNPTMIAPSSEESKVIYQMWKSSSNLPDPPLPESQVSYMKDTKMSSTLFMQPQYRNRHSYMIFGGYLLRQTFELAYCAAASFSSAGPRFVSLDSTTFKAPVPVGSVCSMVASISYTEHLHDDTTSHEQDSPFDFKLPPTNKISNNPEGFLSEPGTLIQVKVDTFIQHLESQKKKEAGTFIYSFFVPHEDKSGFCSVIPQTYSEMMTYIGGRRRALDTAQYVETLPKPERKI
ncbi:Acyl-coenzyme A thioesterase 9 mitochondrial [Spathaspora sp. JA1]|nr:Acyl-coenzyme A thioesterase 9 mitochondrial [Spathaspora sp. JA1]